MELALAGMNGPDIAKTVGLTSYSVNMIMRSPIFQAELAFRRKEREEDDVLSMDATGIRAKATSILEQASIKAANKLESLLNSPDDSVALRAGTSILDRVFGKGDKQSNGTVINITAENVQLLNQALSESRNIKDLHDVRSFQQPAHDAPADSQIQRTEQVSICQGSEGTQVHQNGCRSVHEQGEVSKVA